MAIKINTGFEMLNDSEALDSRCLYDTVGDMASATVGIYEGCMCYVKTGDEKGYYTFSKNNDLDATLGYWRPFQTGGGAIDDSLEESLEKTYSVTKIKELLKKNGGYILVDALPDLSNSAVLDTIELNKIYLVPVGEEAVDKNAKEEYICVHVGERNPVITVEGDYNNAKTEIESYVSGGGNIHDSFEVYSGATSTTLTEEVYKEVVESIVVGDVDFSAYTTRTTVTESYAWEKFGSLEGDAGLVWEEETIVNNPIGRVKDGLDLKDKTILEIVTKMLQKNVPTEIELVGNPVATVLYEKGVAKIENAILTATITKGTGEIADGTNVIFKKGGVQIDTQPYVEGQDIYTYTDTGVNLIDTEEYSVEVAYTLEEESKTATSKAKYEFSYPIFYGSSNTKSIADVTALTKIVEKAGKKELTYTVVNGYCVIAIPSTMTLSKILDQNGFDNTDSFDSVEQITTVGTESVNYKVYTNKNACSCTNFKYIFTIA